MKRTLQILALVTALGAAAFWLAAGANRGWTKTSVPVKTLDELLGIEGITYEKRFVPGLDFLGAAVLGAGALAGVSLLAKFEQIAKDAEAHCPVSRVLKAKITLSQTLRSTWFHNRRAGAARNAQN